MDFDANALIASLVPSSIGFVMFVYGKRQSRAPHMVVGLVMSIFPYFVSNIPLMFGIAGLLCLALWLAVRSGA